MKQLRLDPIQKVNGVVNIPGSKSISNRALLLATLAEGRTTLTNLLDSDDIRYMLASLKQLGVDYQLSENNTVCELQGLGKPITAEQAQSLFLGNAGTAMRPLCAALTLGSGEFTLTGEPRMEERPIGDLVDALRQLGAEVSYLKNDGFPPLTINANGLNGGDVEIAGDLSSQFLTALLMVAPLTKDTVNITIKGELVSKPYIDITIALMARFGVEVINHDYRRFEIPTGQKYVSPGKVLVEGDASSASYFLAAGAIQGGEVKVTGVGKLSIQGDVKFADVLEKMGADIEWGDDFIIARQAKLTAVDLDMNHIPDAAMTIATAALFAEGTTRITNIYNWRIKETDRLAAMATELRKVGATVDEGHDYITVTPPAVLNTAAIDTYNDHRMAMCFSMLAFADCGITINDPDCTSKTFPAYFTEFARIGE
ncbi:MULTISPECIES: 3-phosphoshikimate 1-carboxyvinyltransferase [unclassified Shewanella]|uniref:3-phosphoshikimate 1-carboxyvinyltransferase n=1 Tax=unclassified Shewanella TaxID=196818 RepID=UPI000C84F1FF|nr:MULTISPECIES: 3-phosphoshikimate 1-carboxyvinyltransferase [unclassified Shewanella]MDO6640511.1 3-phosphoshikimate 1-carboxyvinyltransferase [Shewanella sp. 5_MG-2023]MDO6678838.1 3-phosphoshikimate 1-carboxyvinyltransferase [Shewanella sp. 4_MG-2023]MDO6776188.1 3-phosphoshikimate 1-carboxyvinyltransferase [Shewanella sp. 3_MG-2023]PMG43264.1 3-phosphoshikimate 1-carboxyvinyltransferase [Shewanella sp. 10N.286.52.B9]PMH85547.1 3-phosphoshikimate 1-carboxyvinyltransferase [Shewanella sp. 1